MYLDLERRREDAEGVKGLLQVAHLPVAHANRACVAERDGGPEGREHEAAALGEGALGARGRVVARRPRVAARRAPRLMRHDHVNIWNAQVLQYAAVNDAPKAVHVRRVAKVLGLNLKARGA